MNSRKLSIFIFIFCCVLCFYFSSVQISHASYQKIAPGDTVTIGEFVFDDDFVATTTPCTVGITDPTNTEKVASTTLMTANNDGWHYYNYTTAEDAVSGVWPSIMICGSVQRGDLVIVDKSFIVDWSLVSTSTIKEVIDESLIVATSSLSAVISAHIDIMSATASSSIASFVNANTNSTVLAASTSLAAFINANTDVQVSSIASAVNLITESASTSLAAAIQTASSSIVSQISSFFADIPANVWNYISQAGRLASNVWGGLTRTLTSADLDSGSLATLSDIQNASSSVVAMVNDNTNSQTSGITSAVNANTDAQILSASTSIASAITDSQTAINANTDSQISGAVSSINTNTETASSSITSVINANTDLQITTASSSIVSQIVSYFVTIPTDVWSSISRTLTGADLDSGSLATQSYIDTATSTLTAEIQSGWTVTLSDFGETTVNTAYKAKLQILNYATVPTDADSLPTVVITDSAGSVQVLAPGSMNKESDGTYSYSYTIAGSPVGGVWETEVSVVVDGETIEVNDYWTLSSSPADIQIIEITDKVIPTITAGVRIDNKGTSSSDFYYVYCIVDSEDNLCGGNDDIDYASDTAYINAGDFINLSLTLDDVPTAGTYWFKVKARALAETNWAASSEQFIAESGVVGPYCGDGSCNGGENCSTCSADCGQCGGGGGGGGGGAAVIIPTITTGSCNGADFNADNKVNSVDFSILLAFWQKLPPFKNPCVDINKDGKVNSVDFSILLYQWKK